MCIPPTFSPSTFFCPRSAQWMPVKDTHSPEPAEPEAVSPSGVGTGEDRESVALSARNRGPHTRRPRSDLEGDRGSARYRRTNGELASRARVREARVDASRLRLRARDGSVAPRIGGAVASRGPVGLAPTLARALN